MKALNEYFRRRSPIVIFLLGTLLLALVWRLDLFTSTQVSMAIFYLLPIGFVAWYAGVPWSYLTAFLSAVAWFESDVELHHLQLYHHWGIPFWNAMVRLGFFLIVTTMAGLVQRLRRLNDVERESSRLKSGMVALVSHEFGNALTTMRLALTLLQETKGEEAEAERSEHYAVLERVIAHLQATTSNFLNLNRLEGGRFRPQLRLTRLRSVARAALALLEPMIEERDVLVHLDFPSKGVPVRADPDALSVVMTNLIGNAFKYTPDGGAVTIRISLETTAPPSALVAVEDTGIGIALEDRKRILSGKFRTREATRLAKGYGVGLRVVSELLESQGSALGVESQPGKGSRFFFRLPLWDEPVPLNDRAASNVG